MVSTKAIRQAIYQKLNQASLTTLLASGSASLVHEVAPPGSHYPVCVFGKTSGVAAMRAFGMDQAQNQLWQVKAIVEGQSSAQAERVDKAAHDLLHNADLSIEDGVDLYVARESDVEYVQVVSDVQYRHVGGIYRLIVADSPPGA